MLIYVYGLPAGLYVPLVRLVPVDQRSVLNSLELESHVVLPCGCWELNLSSAGTSALNGLSCHSIAQLNLLFAEMTGHVLSPFCSWIIFILRVPCIILGTTLLTGYVLK